MASPSLNTFGLKVRRPSDTLKDAKGFSKYRAIQGNVKVPDLRYTPRWSTIDIVIDTSNFSYESLKPRDRLLNDYKLVARKALISSITDLEIMANLPILLQNNCKRLKRFFNREEIQFIKKVAEKYQMPPQEFTWGKVPRETIANLKHIQALKEPKGESTIISPVMSKMVEIMTDNYCLSVQRNQANNFLLKEVNVLLGLMRDLKDIMEYNFNMSATEERKNRIIYNSAVKQFSSLKEEFQNLSTTIEEKRGIFLIAITNEKKKIQDLLQEKENLGKKTKEDIAQYVTNSEVAMMDDSIESHENQSALTKSAAFATNEYETLRKNNLKREEGLKKKCSKVETVLANWLNLYDTDVGKKRLEYEELKDKLDGLIEDYNNWNAALDEQQELYDECFGEFEEEERERFEELAYQFLRNRSAATIQRYYREYRKKRKEKSKGRKSKKDKKPVKKSASEVKVAVAVDRGADLSSKVEKQFGGDVFKELDPNVGFEKTDKVQL
ncbi:dynein regulatory complex protein 10-like [Agrilus planipennis]|uniref:Dynein regulatory complex protein 10 n=1 Tax=Agrilus planipennis TaxID=224129 RepID=A0A1W4WUU8_AGRPL|nr:dynein regulatory complex protein 10-like [Agrilus planipennis]